MTSTIGGPNRACAYSISPKISPTQVEMQRKTYALTLCMVVVLSFLPGIDHSTLYDSGDFEFAQRNLHVKVTGWYSASSHLVNGGLGVGKYVHA
jgi:hypothetical protein